ncbi:hypothetical protein J6TS1_45870 [Siminovitchia terrae]|uniref:Uncharacterized protein n=1 Tax=Siminovitchia terrae TaxID=1914933 RepID=A0ABQ4L362_SIMTE|nr:hypothetical protein [Siminovitchia terrae]GIN94061.1 hypothetical protein J22TS1_51120 [Siminovitchia terrae]GIN98717.1 hypothetical protein J6TS1_45870 [Siminovitchia terrae]
MNAYWYSVQWGFKPWLNKVKASGGCHRFSEEIYRAMLDKIWAQIRQGAFGLHVYSFHSIQNRGLTSSFIIY